MFITIGCLVFQRQQNSWAIAMNAESLPSLHDIFRILDEDHCSHQATYILQFMWRDVTSKADVTGPYFTSETNLETKFLVSCLFEEMFVFECYDFEVAAACDLCCNLCLLKHLCGVTGQYGTNPEAEGGVRKVLSSFTNLYTGDKTYLIICLFHQVCC